MRGPVDTWPPEQSEQIPVFQATKSEVTVRASRKPMREVNSRVAVADREVRGSG